MNATTGQPNWLVLLAGGQGQRVGGPKLKWTLDGKPIISYLLDRLQFPGPVGLAIRPNQPFASTHLVDRILYDNHLGGSMSHLALDTISRLGPGTHGVLLPIDMPLLTLADIQPLMQAVQDGATCAMVVDKSSGEPHPLPLAFSFDLAAILRQRLAKGEHSLRTLSKASFCSTVSVDTSSKAWLNLNEPADIQRSGLRVEWTPNPTP
jgi:molybdopterin-guanine dinucleotide biosynthesis protein A